MNLYHWDMCKCNEAYRYGDIIVMAESVEAARAKALAYARYKVPDLYQDMERLRNSKDEDDIAEFEAKLAMVDADLRQEPKFLTGDDAVIFLSGSE